MTTNTPAPAHEAVLTDDEILTATLYGQSEARMIRNGRAIESALLSKLRAPVAVPPGWKLVPVEPTPEMEQAAADYLDACVKAWGLWIAMLEAAPSASAPVAGETQKPIGFVDPVYVAGRQRGMPWNATIYNAPNQEATAPLYAAPQASEAGKGQQ